MEHLNRYSRYYNPALAKAIYANTGRKTKQTISYTWLDKKSLDMARKKAAAR
ncbi:hypothetical protein [Pontibacter indicus]|uniref:hypothetical protein n=1 Tax=Pontibacter indicus TaxID=1317125 RepID=UPI00147E3D58|nr:hypothetical protein [Pontibacter indicus]